MRISVQGEDIGLMLLRTLRRPNDPARKVGIRFFEEIASSDQDNDLINHDELAADRFGNGHPDIGHCQLGNRERTGAAFVSGTSKTACNESSVCCTMSPPIGAFGNSSLASSFLLIFQEVGGVSTLL
jgi:hypothetical protein